MYRPPQLCSVRVYHFLLVEVDGLTCIFDVLERHAEHTLNLIEIKSSTKPKSEHFYDFEYFPTSSSFVNGLWYDQSNQYMIILLNSTYYHYCRLPLSEWRSFKSADSFGTYYNQRIKGNYDCRQGYVPSY